ncbi:MAG: hypothetical protein KatS3mg082_1204 [Nitrospiraceae bacterium]|nr:MAG: hypothetical protein KatS3mg082_1204 [Nitrospiraceae bacterium]
MLAYSSIAHAGYALIGLVAAGRAADGNRRHRPGQRHAVSCRVRFHDLGCLRRRRDVAQGRGFEGEEIEDFTGLAKRQPVAALLMLVFMVSLAGIPPTAGFIGKFYLFMAAVNGRVGLAGRRRVALRPPCRPIIICAWSWSCTCGSPSPAPLRYPAWPPRRRCPSSLACAIAGVVLLGLFPNPLVSLTAQAVLTLK